MFKTLAKAEPQRETTTWRIEERRIYAANCYRIDWWRTYSTRESAMAEFDAVARKAAPGFYDFDADHRLVLVEDGAR